MRNAQCLGTNILVDALGTAETLYRRLVGSPFVDVDECMNGGAGCNHLHYRRED